MDELLIQALRAGEVRLFDLQLARHITEVNGGESVPELTLAAALVSYRLSCGDTCIAIDNVAGFGLFNHPEIDSDLQNVPAMAQWREVLLEQKVVTLASGSAEPKTESVAPLTLDKNNRLYLSRYWYFEQSLLASLVNFVESRAPEVNAQLLIESLEAIYGESSETDWQRVATATAVLNRLCVITGGPGTGKTYTVAAILSALAAQGVSEGLPVVALAAPTGKAAARLTQSLQSSEILPDGYSHLEAQTLHRLLGLIPASTHPRYHVDNPLPFDVLVVDEASMIDLPMMTRLLNAVADNCRLVLLGDKDQLASVESGMVLGDICGKHAQTRFTEKFSARLEKLAAIKVDSMPGDSSPIVDHIVYLNKSHRAQDSSGIVALSQAINCGDVEASLELFSSDKYRGLTLFRHEPSLLEQALQDVIVPVYKEIASLQDPAQALEHMSRACVLCALKRGRGGAQGINLRVSAMLEEQGIISTDQPYFFGRPLMITENSASQNLFNGDFGIAWADDNVSQICFQGESGVRVLSPSRLPLHETFYAMTIHKSQGSEYDSVVIVLPKEDSPLLTRELLYTAVTRARRRVTVIANDEQLASAIRTRSHRQSGIQDALWPVKQPPVRRLVASTDGMPVQTELDF